MSAISDVFVRCKAERRSAFIPFLTAGDPDLGTTGQLMHAMVRGGADIIELGVPFSDPIADGPVIQRASMRSLEGGTTLSSVLHLVARERYRLGVPIVLFTYYNPIHARGVDRFAEQAASSGVDGVLCVDLPPDEGDELITALQKKALDPIFLLAPTSTKDRIKKVNETSSGFVYYVSRTGVTGAREALPKELLKECKRLRKKVSLPLAVGFGISTPEQVASVASAADGVVVGSGLVRLIEEKIGQEDLADAVEQHVRDLTAPLR